MKVLYCYNMVDPELVLAARTYSYTNRVYCLHTEYAIHRLVSHLLRRHKK